MKLEKHYRELHRLQEDSIVLRALRSHSLALTGAFLLAYFSGDARRVPVDEMHEMIRADREALSFSESDRINQTPPVITQQWVDRGLVARRQDYQTRAEYFELTKDGANLVEFLQHLDRPTSKATQSRLSSLTQMLVRLEMETNPDRTKRVEALERQRAEIDRQIERIQSGNVDIAPQWQVMETLRSVVHLAREVPLDFLRVRDEFEQINRTLRRDLLESTQPQEQTLTEVFLGIDHVQSSEPGKSFDAFYGMLLDEERRLAFDSAVEALAERGYLDCLPPDDVFLMAEYSYVLQRGAMPVRDVMTTLSRNLRQFVQSRQFQHYRAMMERLNDIQRLGLQASQWLRPTSIIPGELELSTARLESVARLTLRYPDDERTDEAIAVANTEVLDIEALRDRIRESEIDFDELEDNVNCALRDSGQAVDLARVCELFPPTQGVASIIGLLSLGMRYGHPQADPVEIRWKGQSDGIWRVGRVSNYNFDQPIGKNSQ